MNLGGREYVFSQEKGFENVGSWIPVTPEKPVSETRSNLISVDRQEEYLGRGNWQQLLGLPFEQTRSISTYAKEAENYSSSLQNGNQSIPNSFLGLLAGACDWDNIALADQNQVAISGNGGMSWNENSFASTFEMENAAPSFRLQNTLPNGGIHMSNRPLMFNLNTRDDADWTIHGNNMASISTRNHCYNSNSEPWSESCIPQDSIPVPFGANYNLNSLPRTQANCMIGSTNCYAFAPLATDQERMSQNSCLSEIFNNSVVENATHGRGRHDEAVTSIQNGSSEQHCDELLQSIVETSVPDVTAIKEVNNEEENDQGIDLNKTPPQKPAKRKKHRPKVVIEGKPKKTPKPAVPRSANPLEKPAGKRKYVRKNNIKFSETHPANVSANVVDQTIGNAPKSCRRMLNFDLERAPEASHSNIDEQQTGRQTEERQAFNLNLDYQARVTCEETNNVLGTKPVQQNLLSATNQHAKMACNIAGSTSHMPNGNALPPKRYPPTASATTLKDLRKENINLASNANNHCSDPRLRSWKDSLNSLQYNHAEGIYSQARSTPEDIERSRLLMWQRSTQAALTHAAGLNEARRLKREHHLTFGQNHLHNLASKDPPLLHQQIAQIGKYTNHGSKLQKDFPEPDKRRKTDNGPHSSIASIVGHAFPSEVDSRQISINRGNNISRQQTAADINMSNGHHVSSSHSRDTSSTSPIIDAYNFLKQHDLIGSFSCGVAEEDERSNRSTQDFSLVTANMLLPPTPQKSDLRSRGDQGINSSLDNNLTRKQVEVGIVTNALSSCSEATPLSGDRQPNGICSTDRVTKKKSSQSAAPNIPSTGCGRKKAEKKIDQPPSTQGKGMPNIHTWSDLLDQITSQLKDLGIADQEQNAIVPYKADGTMVAYVTKKRKPRPKVDLDPETERLWNLLMGSEDSEGTKGTDKDKEQWWEEERKVFRGRADSFISRMHLVQGDRRFSQWKGSVVDSVIGVFLTQNVSDHLSSSAFMALTSRFPVKTPSSRTCYEDEKGIIVEEPEVSFEEQDKSVKLHDEVLCEPLSDGHSFTVQSPAKSPEPATQNKSSACQAATSINFTEIAKNKAFQAFHCSVVEKPAHDENFVEGRCQPEAVASNHTPQLMEKLDHPYGYSAYTSVTNPSNSHGRVQTVLPSNYRLHITPDPRVLEDETLQLFGRGIMPSWPACDRESINLNGLEWMSNRFGQNPPGSGDMAVRLNGLSRQQHLPILKVTPGMPPQHSENSLNEGFNKETTGYSSKYNSNQETAIFPVERTSITTSSTLAEGLVGQKGSNIMHISSVLEPTRGTLDVEERASVGNEQILLENKAHAFEENRNHGTMHIEKKTAKSKPRKVKMNGEKKNAFDWDSLRRQSQSKCTRGRTRDTMDSMDYEAIRNATVNEISNTIRERGMNNMLADRIKDFLDRTVREHGSIDLEWLRDAPPDKVKEYLLSIRGLGLKSVECVRLLTLHHLAFPVDTNVGRIAVRLGWVPLQPLPESLQLHLLEMYPMLESIQKYLWPRLCKLDQRTLYELHYQMITFGKVFCTKSKPNCNACPLRGECRHFASAFASARLALPGPEEKRIVTSNVPTTPQMNNAIRRNPMMLPHLERNPMMPLQPENTPVEERSKAICEPIIEEPASPEPEPEVIGVTESDIEDAFWEDPDEIPTIKLNIKDFTQNLQNYMQENNFEIQDGDMSKALVALDPAAASIPTQKLKNVSRLRTEHQVYELPDSHPLLKGFERREPDDPSPYLLAIWTPGETANSTEAPEGQCGSQNSGKLCNNMTCFSCNSIREANSNTVRGTILIPCRTAMRGSFPLNGTYFQVNEMFADHDSSIDPLNISRQWIWNLPRRTVFFGTSVSTIFKGLSTEQIQYCFWRGFVCVRGFDKKSRAPKPLMARLHFPASKIAKAKDEKK